MGFMRRLLGWESRVRPGHSTSAMTDPVNPPAPTTLKPLGNPGAIRPQANPPGPPPDSVYVARPATTPGAQEAIERGDVRRPYEALVGDTVRVLVATSAECGREGKVTSISDVIRGYSTLWVEFASPGKVLNFEREQVEIIYWGPLHFEKSAREKIDAGEGAQAHEIVADVLGAPKVSTYVEVTQNCDIEHLRGQRGIVVPRGGNNIREGRCVVRMDLGGDQYAIRVEHLNVIPPEGLGEKGRQAFAKQATRHKESPPLDVEQIFREREGVPDDCRRIETLEGTIFVAIQPDEVFYVPNGTRIWAGKKPGEGPPKKGKWVSIIGWQLDEDEIEKRREIKVVEDPYVPGPEPYFLSVSPEVEDWRNRLPKSREVRAINDLDGVEKITIAPDLEQGGVMLFVDLAPGFKPPADHCPYGSSHPRAGVCGHPGCPFHEPIPRHIVFDGAVIRVKAGVPESPA